VSNLAREGVSGDKVVNVGDVMYDAALYYGAKAEKTSKVLKQLELEQGSYILATCHRAENTDDEQRLRALFGGLGEVAAKTPVVLPLHPRTRGRLDSLAMLEGVREKIKLIDPLGYLDMVMLEKHAALVVTDSGGVQKEAFFYEAPCVTLRDETEWIELVELGWNRLVSPTSTAVVAEGIREGLGTRGEEGQPYGRGDAAERIVDALVAAGK
jgi:UDP-GlcNAc3NAcA epimerase